MRSRLLLAAAAALVVCATASAELVAPGVEDGLVAVTPNGAAVVSFFRGDQLIVRTRGAAGRWRTDRIARFPAKSSLVGLRAGASGAVLVVVGPSPRTLSLVRRHGARWQVVPVVGRLRSDVVLGWPGLALDGQGLPLVAFTRWNTRTRLSSLVLARVGAGGQVRYRRITAGGFPKSFVAPPAAPVVMPGGTVHVVESYGIDGAVGTIDWTRSRRTWSGQFIDGGYGDFPIGPLFAALGPRRTIYAAWTAAFLGTGDFPVTLATRGRSIDSNFVLNRALTTGLAFTTRGAEVGANEWVSAGEAGLDGSATTWAARLVGRGRASTELDGWIAGLAGTGASRDVLLSGPAGLSWFRSRAPLATRVTLNATPRADGSVLLTGTVRGAAGGTVTLYRERPGARRRLAGGALIAPGGAFALVDRPASRPLLYRAVYADPASGLPYAALLRQPVE